MARKGEKYSGPIDLVCDEHGGVQVNLVLDKRLDNPPGNPYYCLRWWTFYPGSKNKYRRFYKYKEKFWTIPTEVAASLMRRAEDKVMFREYYDGCNSSNIIDSRVLAPADRQSLVEQSICDEGEPDWGDDPIFVMSEAQGNAGIWREMMVVNPTEKICTFRSTTTFPYGDYKPASNAAGIYPPWRIDNTMQEVDPALMREYLRVLEEIAP